MKKELNWAVLGCGVIANEIAQALEHMENISTQSATARMTILLLRREYGVQKVYDDFRKCS